MITEFDVLTGDRITTDNVGSMPNDRLMRSLNDLATLIYTKPDYVDFNLDEQIEIISTETARRRSMAAQKVDLHYADDNLPKLGLYSSDNDRVCYDVTNVVRITQGEDSRHARIIVTYDRMSANRRTLGNRCAGEEFFSKIVSKGL